MHKQESTMGEIHSKHQYLPGSEINFPDIFPISAPQKLSRSPPPQSSVDVQKKHCSDIAIKVQTCLVHLDRKSQSLKNFICKNLISVSRQTLTMEKDENENKEAMVEEATVTLRTKRPQNTDSVVLPENLSEEWRKRLTDYRFLAGTEEDPTTRRKSLFARASTRKQRRSSLKRARNSELGYQCATCKMIVHKSCLNKVSHTCSPDPPKDPEPRPSPRDALQDYPWWAERMSRNEASLHLGLATEGTFLLRWSEHNMQPVLSLKALGEVKHMRVYRQEETNRYYLSEARYFTSVMGLVSYYRNSPLSESFTGLDCCLRRPIYDTAVVRYPYEAPGPGHLRLVPGQRVTVISREGEGRGWWKGRIGSKMGYFPREYVTLEPDPIAGW